MGSVTSVPAPWGKALGVSRRHAGPRGRPVPGGPGSKKPGGGEGQAVSDGLQGEGLNLLSF